MKKYLEESIGAHWHRKPRPPLRTFNEICEMFNVTKGFLQPRLKLKSAPKAKLITSGKVHGKATWYDVKEMRDWLSTLPEYKKSQEVKV